MGREGRGRRAGGSCRAGSRAANASLHAAVPAAAAPARQGTAEATSARRARRGTAWAARAAAVTAASVRVGAPANPVCGSYASCAAAGLPLPERPRLLLFSFLCLLACYSVLFILRALLA